MCNLFYAFLSGNNLLVLAGICPLVLQQALAAPKLYSEVDVVKIYMYSVTYEVILINAGSKSNPIALNICRVSDVNAKIKWFFYIKFRESRMVLCSAVL